MTLGLRDAERVAAAIGPLRLARARARQARQAGSHQRRTAGPGSEFWQYRTLEPGEPSDKVDWRRSARSDELYVRMREREDPVRLWLWADGTPSMDFSSASTLPTKAEFAKTLVSALSLSAHEAGETCCVPPETRPVTPAKIFTTLDGGGGVPELPMLGPADIIIAAGDFLDVYGLEWVRSAALSGTSGVIVAVQDPAEIAFPFNGRVRFEAIEDGEVAHEIGHAERLRVRYAEAWSSHRKRLMEVPLIPNWLVIEAPTDTIIEDHAFRIAAWLRNSL